MRKIVQSIIALAMCVMMDSAAFAQGVWTPLKNGNPLGGCGTMMLLTDGTVIVQGPGATKAWMKLTPDSSGNYINGTWSGIAQMGTARLYFGSNVLPSGKVVIIGGEYSGPFGNQNFTNTGEIYDPVANKWTAIATYPEPQFGDDPTVLLPSGKILCGDIGDGTVGGATNGKTYLYDPTANTWTATGVKLRKDQSDEETWILLPDGSVLSYDVFASPATGAGTAQRYVPSTGTWVDTGPVPIPLTSVDFGFELGPATLLPDGRVLQIGANRNSAIYTPLTNTWVQGPTLPLNQGSDDAPGAMLPNGMFLFAADTSTPNIFTAPTRLFSFDYSTNQSTEVTPAGLSGFLSQEAFTYRMLILPNGHMLLANASFSTIYDLAPTGSPKAAWAPTIKSVTTGSGNNSFILTGTQLTGISEGASYGDDAEMSTNYPIVRLRSYTGGITYGRTTGWTPGVATGSLQTTVQFTAPSTIPSGAYLVSVIANGIPSLTETSIRVTNAGATNNVTASYSSGTLTLVGDASSNSLNVTYQAGVVRVEGANGTKINGTPAFSSVHSGKLTIAADLNDGDDALSVIGVSSTTSTINLGPGNDRVAFTLSNFTTLNIDGGAGTDVVIKTTTTIGTLHQTTVP